MVRVTGFIRHVWTRLLNWRYREQRLDEARQDRDAAERMKMAEEGIRAYGRPNAPGPGI